MFGRSKSCAALLAVGGVLAFAAVTAADPAGQPDAPPLRDWLSHPIEARGLDTEGMGAIPSDDDTFAASAHLKVTRAARLPAEVMLTEYLPPVANQGGQQSCVAWSSGYYVFSYEVARARHFDPALVRQPKWEFSPSFIYNQAKSPGGGMSVGQAFEFLQAHGCATLAEMPYDTHDDSAQPNAEAKERAAKFQNHTTTACLFMYLQADPEAMKTYLAERQSPFTMSIPIYVDFPRDKVAPDYVYNLTVDPKDRRNLRGGHAITVVGYSDEKKAFRIVNSWGDDWGDNGFLWISQDFVKKYALEAWTEVAGGPTMRGFSRGPRILAPDVMYLPPVKRAEL
jgi:C1A family cysteine protease